MRKELKVWEFIKHSLEQQQNVMLLAVVESEGSSPGRQGFKMAVNDQKGMVGSIGGGIMEHKLVELAVNKLQSGDDEVVLKRQVHQEGIGQDRSGMICSGEQTVIIYPMSDQHIPLIDQMMASLQKGSPVQLSITPSALDISSEVNIKGRYAFAKWQSDWAYYENMAFQNKVFVIGAGHVAMAMTQVLHQLGFHVTLMDDRAGLNTLESNAFADKKLVVDYEKIDKVIPEGDSVYIVLMSFGYRTDEVVARRLLGKRFAYFGIMGSKHKMKTMWESLRKDSFPEEHLAKIHTPAGLPIHSKTPEEIAISIASEIIKVKNQ